MKLTRRHIKITLLLLLLAAALAGGISLTLNKYLRLDTYKEEILGQLQQSLHRPVSYSGGDISFRFGPAIVFNRFVIKEPDGTATFLSADRLTVTVAVLPLLEKKIVFRKIRLDRPEIRIERDPSGRFNFSDLLEEESATPPPQFREINIRKGTIRVRDRAVSPEGVVTDLHNTDIDLSRIARGKTAEFRLAAAIDAGGKRGSLNLSGSAHIAPEGKPLIGSNLSISVHVNGLNFGHFWPYYQSHVPFRTLAGSIDYNGNIKGPINRFTSRGKVRISGLQLDYPQVFHAVLAPHDLSFSYDMDVDPNAVAVKTLDLKMDGLRVQGGCTISDIPSGDPRITAHAVTSRFDLEKFSPYIPYGIIVKEPADFIEQHIKGGIYQLDEGKLDGRASQIAHMELGENYNVLYIRGRVENGLITYGPSVPTFNTIKGTLEMRGKDFNLIGMSAKFGGSPFTLNGKITDYPLDKPSGYPFTMMMTPRQAEVAWLLGKEQAKGLTFLGDTTLNMSGNGYTSGYNLSGDWNLTTANYSIPDLISKPAARANTLSFKGSVSRKEARLGSLTFNLAPLSANLSGAVSFDKEMRVTTDIRTNRFAVNELSSVLSVVQKYQAAGKLQATLAGEGSSGHLAEYRWNGDISLAGFSFRPSPQTKSVSNLNGSIRFNGTTMESSHLTGRFGDSAITLQGSMTGWDNPAVNLVFSSPSLNLADFGFRSAGQVPRTGKVNGSIVFDRNSIRIKQLNLQLNSTNLSVKGAIDTAGAPKADLNIYAATLNLDDILMLTHLERGSNGTGYDRMTLRAKVAADTGKLGQVPIKKLSTLVQYEDRKLYLQPLTMTAFDGSFSGRFNMDMTQPDSPRSQLAYKLDNASANQFIHALGVTQEVTGDLTMNADLTAKGRTGTEIRRTALGSVTFRCEEGTIKKFPILSKVFSILNISQLLKFQLPDMVSGGMPYNQITGSLSVHDGIVSSNDLYLASDAINISAVGSLDLMKEEINCTIGVKPLQTVDKVVSTIPIVGWILTGKEKSLVTAYFDVKGPVHNPKVTAIPVKSLGKGVFDIFKRVFQLPAKLITDTGEVIMGK